MLSKATNTDIATCPSPVTSERECLAVIERIKLGVPTAVIRNEASDAFRDEATG